MPELTDAASSMRPSQLSVQVTRWSLILGATAFAVFWMNSLLVDDGFFMYDAPWTIALAFHGLSILLLTVGLVGIGRDASVIGDQRLVIGSVAVAVIGLWTVVPLLFLGLAGLGFATVMHRGLTIVGPPLIVGGLLFLSAWATGARPGFEDAPDPYLWQTLLLGGAITLTAAGCAALGMGKRMSSQSVDLLLDEMPA